MIKRIFYVVLAACAAFMAGGYFLPGEAHVSRSIEIERPVTTVFTLLNRFEDFPAWSPWTDRDPEADYRFSGPSRGVGARMDWSGDPRQVGTGWMEITESRPNSHIRTRLVLEHQGEAETAFDIQRIAGGAELTWTFEADLTAGQGLFGAVLSRYFGLFFDRWIGGDFEKGLLRFKDYAESLPPADFSGLEVALVDADPLDVLYVPGITDRGDESVADALAAAYMEIATFMALHGVQRAGQPMTIARSGSEGRFDFEAAVPVLRQDIPVNGNVLWGRSPSGRAVRVTHRGPESTLALSYGKLAAWMAAHGYREGAASWEQYMTDPGATPEEDMLTHIYILLEP